MKSLSNLTTETQRHGECSGLMSFIVSLSVSLCLCGYASADELRDITGIEELPTASARPWLLYGLALAFLVLTSLFLVGWRFYRGRSENPELPPASWALAELQRIESLALPVSGQGERYHTLVSQVIRAYLEKRFQLRASHQTTDEFLQSIATSQSLSAEHRHSLQDFLERCDLAKFAQVRFSPEECQALGQTARQFVEHTAG
jgi:hypothetical protein